MSNLPKQNCEQKTLSDDIKISDYDELGILVDEKSVRNGDASLCRDAFHFQYGNDEGKDFDGEIKSAVSRWKFGKVKSGNTTVTIPFDFSE